MTKFTASNVAAVLPLSMMVPIHNVRQQQQCGHCRQKFPRTKRTCQIVSFLMENPFLQRQQWLVVLKTYIPPFLPLSLRWTLAKLDPTKGLSLYHVPHTRQHLARQFSGMLPQSVEDTCLEQEPIFLARGSTQVLKPHLLPVALTPLLCTAEHLLK